MVWPLPGGSVSDPATDQNFNSLAQKGGEVEEDLVAVEKEGLPPSGKAGGVLKGEYPDPEFASDMATQAELDNGLTLKQDAATAATDAELSAHAADTTEVHGIPDTSKLATDEELAIHAADKTEVHGISDAEQLAYLNEANTFVKKNVFSAPAGATAAVEILEAESGRLATLKSKAGTEIGYIDTGVSNALTINNGEGTNNNIFISALNGGTVFLQATNGNEIQLNNNRVTKVKAPEEGTDAANKTYVDGGDSTEKTAREAADAAVKTAIGVVYRPLVFAQGALSVDAAAATRIFLNSTWNGALGTVLASPVNVGNSAGGERTGVPVVYLASADYSLSGLTPKLRLRCQIGANNTAPAINFTFGLYPITFSGETADSMILTAGTVVEGSTVKIEAPAKNTGTSGVGSDFTFPANGIYALAVVTSGTLANNSAVHLSAQLQLHHV